MELEKELKINIFSRAKIFIEKMGDFAPFGARLCNNEIKDVVYDPKEHEPNTADIIEVMQMKLGESIKEGVCNAVALAFDVAASFTNSDGVAEKRDALCLRISTDGSEWSEEYFPYMIIDGECVWR